MDYQNENIKATPTFERVLVVDGLVCGFTDDGVTVESEYNLYDFQTYDGISKYKVVAGVAVERSEEELEADRAARPAPPPTTEEVLLELAADHEARLCEIELGV